MSRQVKASSWIIAAVINLFHLAEGYLTPTNAVISFSYLKQACWKMWKRCFFHKGPDDTRFIIESCTHHVQASGQCYDLGLLQLFRSGQLNILNERWGGFTDGMSMFQDDNDDRIHLA